MNFLNFLIAKLEKLEGVEKLNLKNIKDLASFLKCQGSLVRIKVLVRGIREGGDHNVNS